MWDPVCPHGYGYAEAPVLLHLTAIPSQQASEWRVKNVSSVSQGLVDAGAWPATPRMGHANSRSDQGDRAAPNRRWLGFRPI